LIDLIEQAYITTEDEFGIREAVEWGSEFAWPENITVRDNDLAKSCNYELPKMILKERQKTKDNRLSVDRINSLIDQSDPEYARLISLANGMKVFTNRSFILNKLPPTIRPLYSRVQGAVNKTIVDLWKDNLVFILSNEEAKKLGDLHFSPVHWTKKKGKKSGRYLFDASDSNHGSCLNSQEASDMLQEYYGVIIHPTIDKLIRMILSFIQRMRIEMGDNFNYEDVVLWKGDLSRAFTLLNFDAEYCKLLACQLTDDKVLIYHTGMFGWTGTPGCFQVPIRVITAEARKLIKGSLDIFVDDSMGVCMKKDLEYDKNVFRSICEKLLGSKAIAEDKWEEGRVLDWIGWRVDLNAQIVTIAKKNFMKTFYHFFSCNESEPMNIKQIERLASFSSRYSTILRQMKPFTNCLYSEFVGIRNKHVAKTLTAVGVQAIQVWRSALSLLQFNELKYARSFNSFQSEAATILIWYDASLTGIGVSVYDISNNQQTLLAIGSYKFKFNLHQNSAYQNIAEFIACVAGYIIMARLNISHVDVRLKGDSISSLTWASTERFRSPQGRSSALVFTLLGINFDYNISETEHIPGILNTIHDDLSRDILAEELGYQKEFIMDFDIYPMSRLLELCDPCSDVNMLDIWSEIEHCIKCLNNV
jgi:hypothetical protein